MKVAAPPVDGSANTALVELVATKLRVPKTAVRVFRGATSRNKVLEIDLEMSADQMLQVLSEGARG